MDPKTASEETMELNRILTQGREATSVEGGTDDSRRSPPAVHAHAGRRPFRKNGKSRGEEETRETVVVGRVGEGKVNGAEGARSFNELYQLVVTSSQPLGAEGTG